MNSTATSTLKYVSLFEKAKKSAPSNSHAKPAPFKTVDSNIAFEKRNEQE